MVLKSFVLTIAILAVVTSISHASDPSPLQDFCVAVNDSKAAVFVNGKFCKDPKDVSAEDFFKSVSTCISLARIDFAPYGLNPPHTHPRGTEVLAVHEGTLYVGFVLSNPGPNMKNKLFTKILHPGDVFVFPIGLIHFQFNDDVLAKAFQIDKKVVDYLQSQFWWDNN
ncbi:unnamed protein product [Withania somnifera]